MTVMQDLEARKDLDARKVVAVTRGEATSDGAGVKMIRLIGSAAQPPVDPFLMLDFFGSEQPGDYIGGFPDHPHRGFETVTYMLAGRMRHRDNHGHSGVIEAGDVQWMKAGRGLIHSEMPEQDHGLMRGFQLWINLPAAEKMSPPAYQEFKAAQIPVETREGARVKIVAGAGASGALGPVRAPHVDAVYLDVELAPGATFSQALPADHQAFFVLYEGSASAPGDKGEQAVEALALLALGAGGEAVLTGGPQGARALLLAARPLREPIAWSGPFVMNSRQELIQAFEDYRAGRF
ncbi:pirin family protein [Rhodoblastus acidophilus]|uniref:Pirin family protein n=1 Tax=Candidatus Rhodoblastus alkanivorans TaxID=2954117 RepID=A0ABS9Z4T6_9HYPH|nr:pirin family protein [Candidatus Rhodoblastus alkanivorans]MCI4677346.1 pirin family protein [Candidatus Rhodoblastus alkanivorans]MCI4682081.1 pirin family protein [Candidatus Rhodoblastus alkanivorans]MDI4639383.1 pirin family protein [Rhodoblastus acidophilus]